MLGFEKIKFPKKNITPDSISLIIEDIMKNLKIARLQDIDYILSPLILNFELLEMNRFSKPLQEELRDLYHIHDLNQKRLQFMKTNNLKKDYPSKLADNIAYFSFLLSISSLIKNFDSSSFTKVNEVLLSQRELYQQKASLEKKIIKRIDDFLMKQSRKVRPLNIKPFKKYKDTDTDPDTYTDGGSQNPPVYLNLYRKMQLQSQHRPIELDAIFEGMHAAVHDFLTTGELTDITRKKYTTAFWALLGRSLIDDTFNMNMPVMNIIEDRITPIEEYRKLLIELQKIKKYGLSELNANNPMSDINTIITEISFLVRADCPKFLQSFLKLDFPCNPTAVDISDIFASIRYHDLLAELALYRNISRLNDQIAPVISFNFSKRKTH